MWRQVLDRKKLGVCNLKFDLDATLLSIFHVTAFVRPLNVIKLISWFFLDSIGVARKLYLEFLRAFVGQTERWKRSNHAGGLLVVSIDFLVIWDFAVKVGICRLSEK